MQYLETRCYGLNLIIKEYAKFPKFLPMPAHTEHGWTALSEPLKSDLQNDKPLMFVFSKRREKAWEEKSNKPVVVLGAPFIHYKKIRKISKDPEAMGTVVFPSHSTYDLKSCFSQEKFCEELKKLPAEFQPITICLFWLDYIDPKAKIYSKHGFTVTTTGPKLSNSLDFVKNFYNILRRHKYATSNEVGSYTFYAVDLGLPFFLTGSEPIIQNTGGDINIYKDRNKIGDYPMGAKAMKLFSTSPITEISEKQSDFVAEEIGTRDCISSEKLHSLLWDSYKNNHYWRRAFVPYLFASVFYGLFFNGPWIRQIISFRKKLT